MNVQIRLLTMAGASVFALTACATKGALRNGLEEQRQAVASERTARLAGDSAQQANMQREVASLRTDLQGLRSEFDVKIKQVAEGLQFAVPVHFAFNDANVRPEDSAALDRFASVVAKHYPGSQVTVEGFADPAGSARYNLALSKRRADAVKGYVTQKGVDASLVNSVGYGETRLVKRGAAKDAAGAELNRRVVFVIETPANADATKVTASAETTPTTTP